MAGIPKVKITFDADFDELRKGVKGATDEVQSFSDRAADFGKKAAAAFAIAGAAALAFGAKAVKAAAEDQEAQQKLAQTLRATTTATESQIDAVDDWITKQSIATATTDDELRPALSRLVRSVGDVEKSQQLLNLAQELSVATGKPLEATTNALAKSYDGNNAALGKLGLGIDAATLKTMSHDQVVKELGKTYTGFIENESKNAQFQFEQLTIAVGETQESIGAALLPIVQELTTYILENVVPAIQGFVAGLTGDEGAKDALGKTQDGAIQFGEKIRGLINIIIDFKDELKVLAITLGAVFVATKIIAFVSATVTAIKTLVTAMNALKNSSIVAGIAAYFALNPLLGLGIAAATFAGIAAATAAARKSDFQVEARAMGGSVNAGQPYLVGERGAELFMPKQSGSIVPNNKLGGNTININVSGAIDPIGTARTIANILNREATTSGAFTNLGISRVVATS